MKTSVRIPRPLYEEIRTDLQRPHTLAFERIGFVSASTGNDGGDHQLIMLHDYQPVLDSDYIADKDVGARINSNAIRRAMQRILDTGKGLFHVHLHPHKGSPKFSRTDLREQPRLLHGFQNVGPTFIHGLLLLSYDSCAASALFPGQSNLQTVASISLVGFPFERVT